MAELFFGATDQGKARDNNEDAFLAQSTADQLIMAAVIDGVGGYEGGEIAAAIARDNLIEHLQKAGRAPALRLNDAVRSANEKIMAAKYGNDDHQQMACVVSAALIDATNNQLFFAHVGDTRIYLLRDESLVKLTHDQSFVGFLEDSGRLTEEQAMTHPKRNEINNALGFKSYKQWDDKYLETGSSPFLPGDALLLCSDGLTDLVNVEEIKLVLNTDESLEQKTRRLIAAANDAGGKDNITVVLVKHPRKPAKQKRTRPVLVKKENDEPEKEQTAIEHAREVLHAEKPLPRKSSGRGWMLIILLLIILGAVGYYFWRQRQPQILMPPPATRDSVSRPDPFERSSQIQLNVDTVDLSQSELSVHLNDSLRLDHDSIVIHGRGRTLVADSNYKGAGLVLSAANRYLYIDSLVFKGFSPAIMASDQRIVLNAVRFQNCDIPVGYGLFLPQDSVLSITLNKPGFSKISKR